WNGTLIKGTFYDQHVQKVVLPDEALFWVEKVLKRKGNQVDPTDEFPNNKNNNFKVRLPTILNLPGDTWQASLWSVSVADEGHSPTVLSSNQDIGLIKYRYTFTQRYQAADNSWLVDFKARVKEVTLKDVM
ncbi:unnamed protein product, partial [Porites evermanni]